MVQPRTVSQEIAKKEDVRVTKTNEVLSNVSRPSYQHQEVLSMNFLNMKVTMNLKQGNNLKSNILNIHMMNMLKLYKVNLV